MKKLSVILLISLLFTLFALPASADGTLSRVIDDADLLSSSEETDLQNEIDSLMDEHSFDFVIVYVDDIGSKTPRAYADDYFDYNGYGYGSDRDGILLLVSMAERDWYISTSGSGISYFSDATLDSIGEEVAYYLSDGDYYDAAREFLSLSEAVLNGDYSGGESDGFPFFAELIVAAVAIALAFIVAGMAKRSMNTARKQTSASSYVGPKGANITVARDTFLFSRVTKVKIESSSSGGGSSHRSSSGRSHGGRGGKF